MKNALKFLSGSAATYFLMAACADAPKRGHSTTTGGSAPMIARGGTTSAGGTTSSSDADDAGWGGASGLLAGGANDSSAGAAGMFGTMTDPIPDASAEPATDGSRLKAIYLVGADGSRQQQLYTWWDIQRGEECSFTTFADGSTRCVPSSSATGGVVFSDSGCSTQLFYAPISQCQAGAAKYSLGAVSVSCNVVVYPAIYSLKTVTPTQVFTGTPAACTAMTATAMASYSFYTGTPIALSSFVSATKEHG